MGRPVSGGKVKRLENNYGDVCWALLCHRIDSTDNRWPYPPIKIISDGIEVVAINLAIEFNPAVESSGADGVQLVTDVGE